MSHMTIPCNLYENSNFGENVLFDPSDPIMTFDPNIVSV